MSARRKGKKMRVSHKFSAKEKAKMVKRLSRKNVIIPRSYKLGSKRGKKGYNRKRDRKIPQD